MFLNPLPTSSLDCQRPEILSGKLGGAGALLSSIQKTAWLGFE
jgi:hypothetical protein